MFRDDMGDASGSMGIKNFATAIDHMSKIHEFNCVMLEQHTFSYMRLLKQNLKKFAKWLRFGRV